MRTCVITGSGDGIGKAVAYALSKTDFFDSYALPGRNKPDILDTMKAMREASVEVQAEYYEIDFSKPEHIPQLIENIMKRFQNISCLLNIAGYTEPQSLLSTSLESFDYTYKVNVYSPFMMMKECTRYMKNSGGKIVNVASTAGMTPRPGWLSYASSKAAIISMSQTLTAELAEYGIKVYCVSPGRCATKLRKRLAPEEDPTTIMQPKDVAEVICRLVAPEEQCLDGQNIVIRKQV
ncbi:MAG: SDR family oxidoreductase [Lachnospiraceae bacterium]|nr:SDR family oxidoreductase [Lachnospiraceae bacterium]